MKATRATIRALTTRLPSAPLVISARPWRPQRRQLKSAETTTQTQTTTLPPITPNAILYTPVALIATTPILVQLAAPRLSLPVPPVKFSARESLQSWPSARWDTTVWKVNSLKLAHLGSSVPHMVRETTAFASIAPQDFAVARYKPGPSARAATSAPATHSHRVQHLLPTARRTQPPQVISLKMAILPRLSACTVNTKTGQPRALVSLAI